MSVPSWNWYYEYTTPHHGYFFAVQRYIYSGETAFQRVDIIDTHIYGRCLILDGMVQSAEFDEYIYHEALIHPAIVLHRAPKQVLVMGGGEGAVLRELCRYPGIEQVVMVDIDREVVELCKEHLARWHRGCFTDSRVELLHMDARRYLAGTGRRFDIIYSDLTEPAENGPSRLLFTRQFYELVKSRLAPGGVLAVQAGGFSLDYLSIHAAIRNTLRLCFPAVYSYHTYIPSFNCEWGFIIASGERDPRELSAEAVDSFLDRIAPQLRFYDGETHRSMFLVPKNIRLALEEDRTIIDDSSPVTID